MACDDEQIYALAVDGDKQVHAFVTFVPIYERYGWGLDFMRRTKTVITRGRTGSARIAIVPFYALQYNVGVLSN